MIGSPDALSPIDLVAISAREARILHWRDGSISDELIASDVPARHRSTGHIRHDPGVRHGGSGTGQDEMERERLEHLRRFLAQVADATAGASRVIVVGGGPLPQRLAQLIEDGERGRPRPRPVSHATEDHLTDRQLRAMLMTEAGETPLRRTRPPRHRVATRRAHGPRQGEGPREEDWGAG
jgi:hypothetical protein